jgi:formylmethanofuran dehydrogenase subunit E
MACEYEQLRKKINGLNKKYDILAYPAEDEREMYAYITISLARYDLLDATLEKLQKEVDKHPYRKNEYYVTSVQEKYGEMRIHLAASTYEMSKIVDEAEEKSKHICEECGAGNSKIRDVNNWTYCLCLKCYKNKLEKG